MGQIVGTKSNIFRCNLAAIRSGGSKANTILAADEVWLVDTTNSLTNSLSGNCDAYIVGNGSTAASALEVKIIEKLANEVYEKFTKVISITPIEGHYINTKNSTIPITNHATSSTVACNYIQVMEGDVIILNGRGANTSNYRFWAMVNFENDVYTKVNESALNVNYTTTPLVLRIPSGVTHLVINWYNYSTLGGSGTIYRNIESVAQFTEIDDYYNEEQSKFSSVQYGEDDLINGYVNSSWSIIDDWGKHLIIDVPKFSKVFINAVGSSNARLYRRKDIYGNELAAAPSNMDAFYEPVTLDFTNGGLLAVNCQNAYVDNFKCIIITDTSKTEDNYNLPHYRNNPFPIKETIKILGIGNSYLNNSVVYLSDMLSAAGVDADKFCIYTATASGKGFDYWATDTPASVGTYLKVAGNIVMSGGATIDEAVEKDWDVIILQQYSNDAVNYGTFNPYLTTLIAKIRSLCTNPNVCIGFNMSWPYANGELQKYGGYPYGINRYTLISKATREMVINDGIDFILPTGTAIENARGTSLNNDYDLSIDGTHLAEGVAKYVAAGVWYQMIFSRIFGVNILTNSFTTSLTPEELATNGAADVTLFNKDLCQKCSFMATINMYSVTSLE